MSGARCGARPAILTRPQRKRACPSPTPAQPQMESRLRRDAGPEPDLAGRSWTDTCGAGDGCQMDDHGCQMDDQACRMDGQGCQMECLGDCRHHKQSLCDSSCADRTATPPPVAGFRGGGQCPVPPEVLQRVPPLPRLPWIEVEDLWLSMRAKDYSYRRVPTLMDRHPALRPHMRAILIDWLIEVCEVHRLHRETFYLGVDFLDRYLSSTEDQPKSQLQLAGITCLMIAAKLEEIYPPKVADFAYVTDGACSCEDIHDKELVILKVLNWALSPLTPQHWLGTYLQLTNIEQHRPDEPVSAEEFTGAQFAPLQFCRACQLLDLAVMDAGSLRFRYGVLAAAALFHLTRNRPLSVRISGYAWSELADCVSWLAPFHAALRANLLAHVPPFDRVPEADRHNIQVHAVSLQLLEEAQRRAAEAELQQCVSPDRAPQLGEQAQLPTPPDSGGRPRPRS